MVRSTASAGADGSRQLSAHQLSGGVHRVICPTGKIGRHAKNLSSPFRKKNLLFAGPKSNLQLRYPAPEKRGVSRSSRTLGMGCDGRTSPSAIIARTNGVCADGEIVWSWRSDAGAKVVKTLTRLTGDGGNQAWSPGRSRISRKTIAQGRPDDPPVPVVLPRAFCCTRTMGGVPSMNDSLEVEVLYPA